MTLPERQRAAFGSLKQLDYAAPCGIWLNHKEAALPRASLSHPVDSVSALSPKYKEHGTEIGELLFPTAPKSRWAELLLNSLDANA